MISSRGRYGLLAVFLVALLTMSCTGSDVLSPTTSGYTVEIRLTDPSANRFELTSLPILSITASPMNTDAEDSLAGSSLGLLREQVELSFEQGPFDFALPLHKGVYRLDRITVGALSLFDLDPPAAGYTCDEWISWSWIAPDGGVQLSNFGQDVYFTVENGAQNQLTILIDFDAFYDAVLASKMINGSACGTTCPGGYPLCDNGSFNVGVFTSQAPSFLSFESE